MAKARVEDELGAREPLGDGQGEQPGLRERIEVPESRIAGQARRGQCAVRASHSSGRPGGWSGYDRRTSASGARPASHASAAARLATRPPKNGRERDPTPASADRRRAGELFFFFFFFFFFFGPWPGKLFQQCREQRDRALGATFREVDRAGVDAPSPETRDMGRHACGRAGCSVAEDEDRGGRNSSDAGTIARDDATTRRQVREPGRRVRAAQPGAVSYGVAVVPATGGTRTRSARGVPLPWARLTTMTWSPGARSARAAFLPSFRSRVDPSVLTITLEPPASAMVSGAVDEPDNVPWSRS